MRRSLLIVCCLCCLSLQAAVFQKSYYDTPLHVVLQDLERHFGLSFLYKPSDVAQAWPITATIKTNDAQKALNQVLGQSLQFTVRNGIIIITKAPEKQTEPTCVRSIIEKEMPQIVVPDTIPEEEPREEWIPIPLLQPGEKLYVSPIDTLRISEITRRAASSLPTAKDSKKQNSNRYNGPIAMRPLPHSFYSGFSFGYGSEINTQLDLQYVYFFHRNWGVSGGFALDYAACYTDSWIQELRLALPIALRTNWMFTPTWGVHGTAGLQVYFPMADPKSGTNPIPFAISSYSVDMAAYTEIDAAYILSPHVTMLFGLCGRLSILSVSVWSIGLHVGFLIGK